MAAERERAACTSAVADAAPSTRPADSSDSSPRRADETEPSERSSRPFTVQVQGRFAFAIRPPYLLAKKACKLRLGAYARGAIGAFGGWQVFDDEESNALDRSQEGKEIEAVLKTYFGAKINQLQQQVQA